MPIETPASSEQRSKSHETAPAADTPNGFFEYFKKYVNGWVAVALILPTAITWKGMPVYESQRGFLVTYTSLSCVLILALLFYSRGLFMRTAQIKSRIGSVGLFLLPVALTFGTGYCAYKYTDLLSKSEYYLQKPPEEALKTASLNDIHAGTAMMAYYILIVVFAEAALFLMAFRDWVPVKRSH